MAEIVTSRPATLSATFYTGEPTASAGTVTVAITRDNGAALVPAAAVSTTSGVATVALTAAEVGATPDLLAVTWTSSTVGIISDTVPIVGAYLVELAEIRGGKATTAVYSAADLARARDWFTNLAEEFCEVAFRPSYARDRFIGDGSVIHVAHWPHLRGVSWATIDGETVDVADWQVDGPLILADTNLTHAETVEVGYTHGFDRPPARLVDAAVVACQDYLRTETGDRRVSRLLSETDQFGGTKRMSYAGDRRPTGIPIVDATLNSLSKAIPGPM